MSYFVTKTIKGKKYRYVVKSIRLPDGSVKQLSRLVKSDKSSTKLTDYFLSKEIEANVKFALSQFKPGNVFIAEEIAKIEKMRVHYKHLLKKLTEADIRDMFDRFTANFTYDSNAIEGNSLTLKDVQIVMFENAVIKGKNLREIYETRNSRTVVDLILKKKFDISHESIIKIHKILMRDIDTRVGYKKIPNFIVGRNFGTTPPERVHEEMEKLIRFHNDAIGKTHPLEIAAELHGRFERIHPFSDGNGRVGRFLINVVLADNGYPPLIIRKTARDSYMNVLGAFDNGYGDKLKRFLLERYKETFRKFFEIYIKYAK